MIQLGGNLMFACSTIAPGKSVVTKRHVYERGVLNEILEMGVLLFHSISPPNLFIQLGDHVKIPSNNPERMPPIVIQSLYGVEKSDFTSCILQEIYI